MAGLIDTIKSSGAPAIFLDIGENQNLAKQIASESGAKVITDLYVESISVPTGPAPTYIDMLKYDTIIIVNALK
jgi:zinc/manganese transport system substrate-binding protein